MHIKLLNTFPVILPFFFFITKYSSYQGTALVQRTSASHTLLLIALLSNLPRNNQEKLLKPPTPTNTFNSFPYYNCHSNSNRFLLRYPAFISLYFQIQIINNNSAIAYNMYCWKIKACIRGSINRQNNVHHSFMFELIYIKNLSS